VAFCEIIAEVALLLNRSCIIAPIYEYYMVTTTSSKVSVDKQHEAILSSAGGFTAFSFGGYNIRFKAPYSLERYTDVVKWENGYLVVMAKYRHNNEPEEEYIDLKPILDGLYIDSASFLGPIKSVRIAYA